MRKEKLGYIITILLLVAICIYYLTKKEPVYVMIGGDCQYSCQFIDREGKSVDSTKVEDIYRIVIKGGSPFDYEWMEVDLDQANGYIIDLAACRKLVTNSPDFITKNYYSTCKKDMRRYKLYVILEKNKAFYVFPVQNILNSIE
jgi:hypothetical protein